MANRCLRCGSLSTVKFLELCECKDCGFIYNLDTGDEVPNMEEGSEEEY